MFYNVALVACLCVMVIHPINHSPCVANNLFYPDLGSLSLNVAMLSLACQIDYSKRLPRDSSPSRGRVSWSGVHIDLNQVVQEAIIPVRTRIPCGVEGSGEIRPLSRLVCYVALSETSKVPPFDSMIICFDTY